MNKITETLFSYYFWHRDFGLDYGYMETLIQQGGDIDFRGPYGRTLLMHAAQTGDIKLAKLLYKSGADYNIKDNDGNNVFYYANSDYPGKTGRNKNYIASLFFPDDFFCDWASYYSTDKGIHINRLDLSNTGICKLPDCLYEVQGDVSLLSPCDCESLGGLQIIKGSLMLDENSPLKSLGKLRYIGEALSSLENGNCISLGNLEYVKELIVDEKTINNFTYINPALQFEYVIDPDDKDLSSLFRARQKEFQSQEIESFLGVTPLSFC